MVTREYFISTPSHSNKYSPLFFAWYSVVPFFYREIELLERERGSVALSRALVPRGFPLPKRINIPTYTLGER